jgi:hypothetical protein
MKKPGIDRRKGQDRRRWHDTPKFPFPDSNMELVAEDRRRLPDRRLSNLSVDWDTDETETVDYGELGKVSCSTGL